MNGRQQPFSSPACQPELSRDERRARGVYYTPPEIVRLVVELTLKPLHSPPRLFDLACGAGEFLIEAHQRVSDRFGPTIARQAIQGVDIAAAAVAAARRRLKAADPRFPIRNIREADALDRQSLPPASFDAIVGNPPYVNIRQLAKSMTREQIDELRSRYQTARGNFDLYALFIERAIELLCAGGRCGLVIPNKWATLDYALTCRRLLLAHTTIEHVIDLSHTRAFAGASVYPQVLIFRKSPASAQHLILVNKWDENDTHCVKQLHLSADSFELAPAVPVESRVGTRPLGQLATLTCGTAGYSAHKIADRLVDSEPLPRARLADFITSGNIDRYAIRLGNVRFMNRNYVRPRLPLDSQELTPAKRRLFTSPKIIIAGMSRRLEAAWDDYGLALGVQVFAAHESKLDPFYLLALLNSKLLSHLFATRYAAKRLGGGYFAVNKGQLSRLPICIGQAGDRVNRRLQDRLAQLAAHWQPSHDGRIDQLVYELYHLNDNEIASVEAHFGSATRAAA